MQRVRNRRPLREIIQKFREKGATSPEKAMTIQELGLPPRFEEAMHRRLGQTGIFVELNGKYYLNEERLRQVREQRGQRGGSGSGGGYGGQGPPGWLRYGGILVMLPIGIIVVAFLWYYFFVLNAGGYFPGEILIVAIVVLLILFVVRLLFSLERRKYWRERWQNRQSY